MEYEERLGELERERQQLEDDKVHVERYKHLLLKQRDIMIGLTSRLNERDESIITMQQEIAQYDSKIKWLTQGNQRSKDRVKQLENHMRAMQIEVPQSAGPAQSASSRSAIEVPQQLYSDNAYEEGSRGGGLGLSNQAHSVEPNEDESDSFYENTFDLAIEQSPTRESMTASSSNVNPRSFLGKSVESSNKSTAEL